ncbi:MAG: hydroxypyruvate isomerase [Planctomycetota bacterium]|jgi:hydroxypyruvate isomerase
MLAYTMERRDFIKGGAGLLSTSMASESVFAGPQAERGRRFKLKYAPHLGMFRHHAGKDPIDQLTFMADEGFRAFEDNGMPRREPKLQEAIRKTLEQHKMEMGVFVAHATFSEVTFGSNAKEMRERIRLDMEKAVEVAERVGAKWCTVVPGTYDKGVEWDYQTANVIDNLRMASDICAPAGLTMVLEPLNPWKDHAGCFLTKVPQAYSICRAVNSPHCKILDDLYHQQITEGNLIPNIDRAWGEIAYFQVGDNPGRKEPGTGEINYRNVFRHIHSKGFDGIVGMEHGNSRGGKEGEAAVIEAYAAADDF